MSLKLGTLDIAGISQNTKYNAHHLLDFKWSDCIINDVSWLRADTFSWQSGDFYTSAYNHLVADIQGTTAETETIGSYTVTFYRATDGHKICLADQETTIANIYSETGIAWYYILDTTNTQFKLPRTKFGFEGLRNNVGDNINESLPNITGSLSNVNATPYHQNGTTFTGVFHTSGNVASTSNPEATGSFSIPRDLKFDASRSSSTYQDDAPVQERATQMYLYFYVGDYTQNAIEQTAGLNAELFNGKVDKSDLAEVRCVIETSPLNILPSWYRVYSDGWCEQGGYTSGNIYNGGNGVICNFLKTFGSTNYQVNITMVFPTPSNVAVNAQPFIKSQTASAVTICNYQSNAGMSGYYWQACGYIEV